MRSEEDQIGEIGSASRLENENISGDGKWRGEEESIIKPNRRAGSSSLEKK